MPLIDTNMEIKVRVVDYGVVVAVQSLISHLEKNVDLSTITKQHVYQLRKAFRNCQVYKCICEEK